MFNKFGRNELDGFYALPSNNIIDKQTRFRWEELSHTLSLLYVHTHTQYMDDVTYSSRRMSEYMSQEIQQEIYTTQSWQVTHTQFGSK